MDIILYMLILYFVGKGKSLDQCGWYWGEIKRLVINSIRAHACMHGTCVHSWYYLYREEVTAKLKDTSDGTFLVRNSQGGQGYTLTVR